MLFREIDDNGGSGSNRASTSQVTDTTPISVAAPFQQQQQGPINLPAIGTNTPQLSTSSLGAPTAQPPVIGSPQQGSSVITTSGQVLVHLK